jgi:hypothetical protein
VLRTINSTLAGKSPQAPTPEKYGGAEDTKEFKQWLSSLLQWLRINNICGLENDSERIKYTAIYLEGKVLSWYNDNVDSLYC